MRTRIILFTANGLLLLALLWLIYWLSGPAVNPRNFDQIRPGMSVNQVEAILGEGGECWIAPKAWPDRVGSPRQYNGEGYSIVVWYDEDNSVLSKADFDWIYRWAWDEPLRYRIRSQLGWYHRSAGE